MGCRRLCVVFALCVTGFAQAPARSSQPKKEQEAVIRTQALVVVAPTTVRTKDGKFVRDLQLESFELYDNDKLQKITADISDAPISLVVAVQSGGGNLQDVLPKVQKVGSLLSDLVAGHEGEIAVIGFDDRVQVIQDFTNESAKISEALKRITPGGLKHALVEAVQRATGMLESREPNRRRILLSIAEKGDKGSEGELREALASAQSANVAIYSIDISRLVALSRDPQQPPPAIPTTAQHIPAGGALTPNTIEQQNYYMGNYIPAFVDLFQGVKDIFTDHTSEVLTRFTGGTQYSFVSDAGLQRAIQNIGEEIHSQYLLSYVPNNQQDGGFHEIKVLVKRSGMESRSRLGYWLPSNPE